MTDNQNYYNNLTRKYGNGGKNDYQYTGPKCPPGCKRYTGNETYHIKDCPFYPNSFSKRYDDLQEELNKNINL